MSALPEAGQVFAIDYPFVRSSYTQYGDEGPVEVPTWRPGVQFVSVGPEDSGTVADGLGKAEFHVVSTHKPGRFPMRVCLTRRFVDPDGKAFGKGRLHIWTLEKFRRLTSGYQHLFGIGEPIVEWSASKARAEFEAMLAAYRAEQARPPVCSLVEGLVADADRQSGEA